MKAWDLYCVEYESSFRIPWTMSDRLGACRQAEEEPSPEEAGALQGCDPAPQ